VVSVAEGSPAWQAGIRAGDELLAVEGVAPRDVIDYRLLVDGEEPELLVRRAGATWSVALPKGAGEPVGLQVVSPVFDRVCTCDNHCAFCFIFQLPKGLRRSLYFRDDDYRLSFLYGNFTTLTRFTELDLERVLEQRLFPLYVSIHTTDPELRARMLRNPRGATSLRWLAALLEAGAEVHGQIVVCPGVNDGAALEATFADVLDRYPQLASLGCVPVGVSRFARPGELRPHTKQEAAAVVELVHEWQALCLRALGRRLVHASDEFYLLADVPFPPLEHYEGLPQHENGIGMARAFEASFEGHGGMVASARGGFFQAVDGAPAVGYRARRVSVPSADAGVPSRADRARGRGGRIGVLTGHYGARVLRPLLDRHGYLKRGVEVIAVENRFFGGNVAVAGLLVGADLAAAIATRPDVATWLLSDACLSEGRFLDGRELSTLGPRVQPVPAEGSALRATLDAALA
jgi:putative radical SAM enzyme (TIGR03279 family)